MSGGWSAQIGRQRKSARNFEIDQHDVDEAAALVSWHKC